MLDVDEDDVGVVAPCDLLRRRGGGANRADQVLRVIRENPGISVSEIGDRLGMKQKNYLYRVVGNLQSEGAVKKDGRGFKGA